MQTPLTFFLAFVVVLVLIGAATWLVRRFAGSRLGSGANRGRMPRLAVIDAAAVDGRRRLVLVRRDNVEHLIMIGGPSDLVVEPNIVRASPPRDQMPGRVAGPTADTINWTETEAPRAESLDHDRTPALPEMPPARPTRTAFPDEPRRSPPPAPAPERRNSDPLAGFTPEPAPRAEPVLREPPPLREPAARPMPRAEPLMPRAPARAAEPISKAPAVRPVERPAPTSALAADQNLAEMAHRLEAALRRPSTEARPETGSSTAAPAVNIDRIGAPSVAPEAPATRPAPRISTSEVTPPMAAAEPINDAKAADAKVSPPTSKTSFKNLEDEMASLLGRPKTPS